ncbi:MAG: hypothetical protein ACI4HQ_04985 [Acetatifactor sp.]
MNHNRCNKSKRIIKTKPSPAINKVERLSPLAFFGRTLKAGMTVEAAIVLPLCLFFLLNLGYVVEMIRLHNHLQLGMLEAGNKAALYGCELGGEDLAGLAASVYVCNEMTDYVGQRNLDNSPLSSGKRDFKLWESSSEDELDITVMYSVSPLLSLMGFDSFYMANRYCAHLWNGYDITGDPSVGEIVYVTETGEVWHKDRGCTYLQLSVKQVEATGIEGERNQWGRRYSACDICAGETIPGKLYITLEGNHYHYRRECPGLKRTVYSIFKEEADKGGYRRCSRCGGE